MTVFYEIIDPTDGHVIQRLAVLTRTETDRLQANGYQITVRQLDRRLWRWLLEPPT